MLKKYKKTILTLLLLLFWIGLIAYVDAESLIERIGTNNGYLIASSVALIGGASSLTSTSYIATIIYFSTTGLSPFLLALFAGTALTIGDEFFYFLARKSRDSFPQKWDRYIDRITSWLHNQPIWVVRVFSFMYTGLTPLPGDLLMAVLSFSQYSFKKVYISIWLGNMTLIMIISYLAHHGFQMFAS